MLCHSYYHNRNARRVSGEKRCQNIVKAGSIDIVGQHYENVLDIFILYIVTQSDFPFLICQKVVMLLSSGYRVESFFFLQPK